MNPLDDRYIGSVCEIRSFTNELQSIGVINDISGDNIIIFPKKDSLRVLNAKTKLKINIFNSKAGFTVLTCETVNSTRDMLKVNNAIKIIDHERRTGFRVEVDLTAQVSPTGDFYSDLEKGILTEVSIKNLSMHGIQMVSPNRFAPAQNVWIKFKMDNDTIETKAQIMRESEEISVGGATFYEYGVMLIIDRSDYDDKICSYIFKKQREIAQKAR